MQENQEGEAFIYYHNTRMPYYSWGNQLDGLSLKEFKIPTKPQAILRFYNHLTFI